MHFHTSVLFFVNIIKGKFILFMIEHFFLSIKYRILTKLLLKFAILNLIQREQETERLWAVF